FFSSRRRHTRFSRDWSSDVCSSDLVPSVSIDMQGVSYDAAGGDGGQQVGFSGASAMAAPGQTVEYRFYLDPAMGEGAKVFRSGRSEERRVGNDCMSVCHTEHE